MTKIKMPKTLIKFEQKSHPGYCGCEGWNWDANRPELHVKAFFLEFECTNFIIDSTGVSAYIWNEDDQISDVYSTDNKFSLDDAQKMVKYFEKMTLKKFKKWLDIFKMTAEYQQI